MGVLYYIYYCCLQSYANYIAQLVDPIFVLVFAKDLVLWRKVAILSQLLRDFLGRVFCVFLCYTEIQLFVSFSSSLWIQKFLYMCFVILDNQFWKKKKICNRKLLVDVMIFRNYVTLENRELNRMINCPASMLELVHRLFCHQTHYLVLISKC